MIELRLIGRPDEIDTALDVLSTVAELHRSQRKPARGCEGHVIQYGVLAFAPWPFREDHR